MVVNKSMRNEINGIKKSQFIAIQHLFHIPKTSKSFVLIFFIYLINFSDSHGPESSLIKISSVKTCSVFRSRNESSASLRGCN